MKLYLVQHGIAASKEQDPQRPLTPEGRRQIEKVARFVTPLGLAVDRLWHSEKARARETAEMYARVFATAPGLTARKDLSPQSEVAPVRDELAAATQDTLIVGHLPFLSKLASLLLTDDETSDVLAFQKAGIVCLGRTPDARWQVLWMVTPDLLA